MLKSIVCFLLLCCYPLCGAVDESQLYTGEIFIIDNGVKVFDEEGNCLREWGSFDASSSIAVWGDVYIGDTENHCIQVFDRFGNFLRKWELKEPKDPSFLNDCINYLFNYKYEEVGIKPEFIAVDGKRIVVGSNDNPFLRTYDLYGNLVAKMELDQNTRIGFLTIAEEKIFVLDEHINGVKVFNLQDNRSNGFRFDGIVPHTLMVKDKYLAAKDDHSIYLYNHYGRFLAKDKIKGNFIYSFGTSKVGNREFHTPEGITTYDDEVFVVDSQNHRIVVFDLLGNFLRKWGRYGEKLGQFKYPEAILIHEEEVFVLDKGNKRVQVFDTKGNFLRHFGCSSSIYAMSAFGNEIYLANFNFVEVFDIKGNFLRKLSIGSNIKGIAVEGDRIFLAGMNGIEIYNQSGELLSVWDKENRYNAIRLRDGELFTESHHFIKTYDLEGNLTKKVRVESPNGFALHGDYLYVTSSSLEQILVYDRKGNVINNWGTSKKKDGEFNFPFGLALDNSELFVCDSDNHRVQVFDIGGNFLRKWACRGPRGIVINQDEVFVLNNHSVQVFDRHGNRLRNWVVDQESFFLAVEGDEVFVADNKNNITVYDREGNFLRQWKFVGKSTPWPCVSINEGRVYILEKNLIFFINKKNPIKVYDTNGTLIEEYQIKPHPDSMVIHNGLMYTLEKDELQILDLKGNLIEKRQMEGMFFSPSMAISDSLIFFSCSFNDRVAIYSLSE